MAAVTSGSLSAAGDALAQALVNWELRREAAAERPFELDRTLRMFGFGFCFYGPLQHWWYGLLASSFPGKAVPAFLSKLALNQFALGPVVLSAAFAWNLGLRGKIDEVPSKLRADLVPTLINGWKFWVPAAGLNFYAVPLAWQVFYMSCCGVLWTAYISFASYNSANAIVRTPVEATKKACCKH